MQRRAPDNDHAGPVLKLAGLSKEFGARRILSDISLDIASGSAVALIGANGAGKSTLLRSLVRLVEPTAGRIELLGEEVTRLAERDLARLRSRVGFVFQRHNLVPRLSALSNVLHGVQARRKGPRGWLQCLATPPDRDEALDCLAAVGLEAVALQRVDSLSGGQSQRVAVARMLMQRPELVLADEPDASLDPQSGEEIMRLLYQLTKEKKLTLIVSSHRLEHARHFSDRIIGLAQGRMTLDQASAAASPQNLRSFFIDRAA
ncbi:MAG: phosphonate ABC transporter ATP-binding protein [Parvibaculaceae bacterium]